MTDGHAIGYIQLEKKLSAEKCHENFARWEVDSVSTQFRVSFSVNFSKQIKNNNVLQNQNGKLISLYFHICVFVQQLWKENS